MKKLILSFGLLFTLSSLATSSWQQIHLEDNISIYSKNAQNGILPFRAIGTINAPLNKVLSTLMDLKNKKSWSPKLKDIKIHKEISTEEMIISEYYKTPWPATDREFLLKGKLEKISHNKYIIRAHSTKDDTYASSSHIQADVKYLDVTIEDKGNNTTSIDFRFHGDLKGWMPIWLTNLIQKKWPLRFIQGLNQYIAKGREVKLSSN